MKALVVIFIIFVTSTIGFAEQPAKPEIAKLDRLTVDDLFIIAFKEPFTLRGTKFEHFYTNDKDDKEFVHYYLKERYPVIYGQRVLKERIIRNDKKRKKIDVCTYGYVFGVTNQPNCR